jgi:hypothetical protein
MRHKLLYRSGTFTREIKEFQDKKIAIIDASTMTVLGVKDTRRGQLIQKISMVLHYFDELIFVSKKDAALPKEMLDHLKRNRKSYTHIKFTTPDKSQQRVDIDDMFLLYLLNSTNPKQLTFITLMGDKESSQFLRSGGKIELWKEESVSSNGKNEVHLYSIDAAMVKHTVEKVKTYQPEKWTRIYETWRYDDGNYKEIQGSNVQLSVSDYQKWLTMVQYFPLNTQISAIPTWQIKDERTTFESVSDETNIGKLVTFQHIEGMITFHKLSDTLAAHFEIHTSLEKYFELIKYALETLQTLDVSVPVLLQKIENKQNHYIVQPNLSEVDLQKLVKDIKESNFKFEDVDIVEMLKDADYIRALAKKGIFEKHGLKYEDGVWRKKKKKTQTEFDITQHTYVYNVTENKMTKGVGKQLFV